MFFYVKLNIIRLYYIVLYFRVYEKRNYREGLHVSSKSEVVFSRIGNVREVATGFIIGTVGIRFKDMPSS